MAFARIRNRPRPPSRKCRWKPRRIPTTGLRNAVLEIEVNGAHRLSQPLPDDLTKPGPHTLKPSIYLDQLDVKTYDIVSYHLSAQRIADAALPPTVSPVQFVQVKPVREDTFICAGGDQPSKCFNYVTALKAAQLRLMKDNFTLAHAEVGHDNSEWRDRKFPRRRRTKPACRPHGRSHHADDDESLPRTNPRPRAAVAAVDDRRRREN